MLNKFQNHVFICIIWIKFSKGNIMLKFEFFKQLHTKHNKLQLFLLLLMKFWNGLVIKALACFHKVLSLIFGGCVHYCISYKCSLQTCTSWWIVLKKSFCWLLSILFYFQKFIACNFVMACHDKNAISQT